jgi:hypothetical protein
MAISLRISREQDARRDFVKANFMTSNYGQMAVDLGVSVATVYHTAKALGLNRNEKKIIEKKKPIDRAPGIYSNCKSNY